MKSITSFSAPLPGPFPTIRSPSIFTSLSSNWRISCKNWLFWNLALSSCRTLSNDSPAVRANVSGLLGSRYVFGILRDSIMDRISADWGLVYQSFLRSHQTPCRIVDHDILSYLYVLLLACICFLFPFPCLLGFHLTLLNFLVECFYRLLCCAFDISACWPANPEYWDAMAISDMGEYLNCVFVGTGIGPIVGCSTIPPADTQSPDAIRQYLVSAEHTAVVESHSDSIYSCVESRKPSR